MILLSSNFMDVGACSTGSIPNSDLTKDVNIRSNARYRLLRRWQRHRGEVDDLTFVQLHGRGCVLNWLDSQLTEDCLKAREVCDCGSPVLLRFFSTPPLQTASHCLQVLPNSFSANFVARSNKADSLEVERSWN